MTLDHEVIRDLYYRICCVTTKYTFTAPLEDADVAVVRAELEAALPAGYSVGVNPTPARDCVGVTVGYVENGTTRYLYRRMMRVVVL